jgi:predicted MPP superfamily phosphohydrolase
VTQVEHIHPVDIFVDALIVVSQYAIARYLFKDAKPRLSKTAFRAVMAAFGLICAIEFGGIVLNIIRSNPEWDLRLPAFLGSRLPPVLGSSVSAIEVLWGFTSSIVVAIDAVSRNILLRLPADFSPSRRRLIRLTTAAAMSAPVAAVTFGGLIERTNFQVREVDLPVPGLHPDFEGFTIAQVSDLHVSPYLSVRQAGRVVDMTNELKPRLTLVTGDLISEKGDPLDATIAEIARLRADLGILGCMGNHEVYAECEAYTEVQARRRGIDFLRLASRQVRWGEGVLNFAGVDYQTIRNKKNYLRGADKLIVTGVPNILLSHNPDVFPVAVRQGYGAVVAGHTHGGQVTIEMLRQTLNVVRFATPYVAGLYRLDGASCYVTAGIGTIGMPVRLGATPEITLLRLRRA